MSAVLEHIAKCKTQSFHFKVDTNLWPVWHFHPEIDLLLFTKNTGHYTIGDHFGDFRPGTLVAISPNMPHSFRANEEDENDPKNPSTVVLQLSIDTLKKAFSQLQETEHLFQYFENHFSSMELLGDTRDHIELLMQSMMQMNDMQRFTQLLLIMETIANAPQHDRKLLVSEHYTPNLNHRSVSKVDRVINYIVQNFRQDLSLNQVSSIIHMEEKTFSRFFKRNTGKSFVNYINELRVEKACQALLETEKSISEICFETGFNSLSNFNRRFLKLKQLTPREYRQLKGHHRE